MEIIKKEKLLFNMPIELEGLGTIHQPTLDTLIEKDFDLNRMVRAFKINKEMLFENSKLDIKNFDIFFLPYLSDHININDLLSCEIIKLLNDLMKSLAILYKTDNIKISIDKNVEKLDFNIFNININDEIVINRNNYDHLCNIVQVILNITKNDKVENKVMSEYERIAEEKRKKFEERINKQKEDEKENENTFTIYDAANYLIHVDESKYTYESIRKLSIYQLKNSFTLYSQKDRYKENVQYKVSGNFEIDDFSHWFFKK